jgi:hypothetical protein
MGKAKRKLPRAIAKQIDKAQVAVTGSRKVLPGTQPLIDALDVATDDLGAKQMRVLKLRKQGIGATLDLHVSERQVAYAYGVLAGFVETFSGGDEGFIVTAGFDTWATRSAASSLGVPTSLRMEIGNLPEVVLLIWKRVHGARLYQVQYTTDLTGATGWIDAPAMTGKTRLSIGGLSSGTRYAFRVRACGNGVPSPWSVSIVQLAP